MRYLLWVSLLVVVMAPTVYAQTLFIDGVSRPLTIALDPQYPEPGETVRLSIESSGIDLRRSIVVWYANGREIARGDDLTEATVIAGTVGQSTQIEVAATDQQGITASAQATIIPAEAELLWETDSFIPPLYNGRALPGSGTTIRFQALARFGVFPTPEKDLIFTWYRNDALVQSASGRGKSSAVFPGPLLFGTDTIRVRVERVVGEGITEASATYTSQDPQPLLYENHPLFGVLYHRALQGEAQTIESELKITAVPLFANTRDVSNLSYEWKLNGTSIVPSPTEPQTLTIDAGTYTGPVRVDLAITSFDDIYLHAVGAWNILFGHTAGSVLQRGLFGNPNE